MKLLLVFVLIFSVNAEIVSYSDENGKRVYVDSLDKVPEQFKDRVRENNSTISKITAGNYEPVIREKKEVLGYNKTILLVTESCPYCTQAEEYLSKNRIKFTKLDVMASEEGSKLYTELGGNGVPVLKHGSQIVRGFDRAEYMNIFRK